MADNPDKPGKPSDGLDSLAGSFSTAYFAKQPLPEVPPSKPLQWFLLGAFLITGLAYVVGEYSELNSNPNNPPKESSLHRKVRLQSDYLEHCKAGDEAFAKKHYDQAAAEYRMAVQAMDTASGHGFFGKALLKQGRADEAFAQFKDALRLDHSLVNVSSDWGLALAEQGKLVEASNILQQGLASNADSGLLHYDMATTLVQMRTDALGRRHVADNAGQADETAVAGAEATTLATEALRHFARASRNKVDSPAFWAAYGQLLNETGQYAEAEPCLIRATTQDDNMARAHLQLAQAEDHLSKYAQAITHYEKVLTLTPDDPLTLNSLALLYATATNNEVRTPKMAVQLATRACDATTDQNALYMDTLARCYAADGNFFQAITWEDKAIHRATQLSDHDLVKELQARQALFMDHKTN